MPVSIGAGNVVICAVSLTAAGVPAALETLASMNSDEPVMVAALKL